MPATAALVAGYAKRFGAWPRMAVGGAAPTAVTFPSTQLDARVWIALGANLSASHLTWNWVNITEWVRHDLGITKVVGRRNTAGRVTAGECQLKVDNTDGRFSRRKPTGPYYGLLGGKVANTPIWIERNAGNGFHDAYRGYVNSWPTTWTDASGADAYVVIDCAGVLRWFEQGDDLAVALERTILADNPVAYWRMDDPDGTGHFKSSMPGGGQIIKEVLLPANTGADFGAVDAPPGGLDSAADMSGGAFFTTRLGLGFNGLNEAPPWTVVWSVKRPGDGTADGGLFTNLYFNVNGSETGASFGLSEDLDVSVRDWYHYKVTAEQNGANWQLSWWRNGIAKGVSHSGAGTLGNLLDATFSLEGLLGAS